MPPQLPHAPLDLPPAGPRDDGGSGPGPEDQRIPPTELHGLVRRMLVEATGSADPGTAHRVAEDLQRLTDGWPVLVGLVLEEGGEPWATADPVTQLSRRRGPVVRWVESRLLPSLPGPARRLLHLVRDLHPVPSQVLRDDAATWDLLTGAGVVTHHEDEALVVPLVAACLRDRPAPADAAGWWVRAAEDYLAEGRPGPALRAARHAEDHTRCQQIIEQHGDAIVTAGWADELLVAVDSMPAACLDLRTRILHGHAARIAGRHRLADEVLESALADTEAWGEVPPPDLVWRIAAVKYGAASFQAARDLCTGARVPLPADEPSSARAMRLATLALTEWQLGDDEAAGHAAAESLSSARVGDDEARATAYLAQSMLVTGARRLNALASAQATAERCGDVFLLQRSLTNLSDAHLVAGDLAAALEAADAAIALVDRTGPAGAYASALHNSGEALTGLGDLEAARVRFLRCLDIARTQGLDRTPAALWGLAEIDYQAGRLDDARVAFEEAVDLARETGERQVLAPALARLATIVAATPREPSELDRAESLAAEALARAPEDIRPVALTALGWVRLARGDSGRAAELAEEAAGAARAAQSRRTLGPALELAAEAEPDPRESGALLLQALSVHQRSGATLAADRVHLALARLPGSQGPRGAAARAAVRRMRVAGVLDRPLHPQGSAHLGALDIRVLGGFAVHRDGEPVPASAWRSRQARTLLKALVARQGRPVGREELCELLWPDDDPARTGHRLSVLLSTLRGALDPDKRHPIETFVAADTQGIRLVLDAVALDLSDFLDDVAEAGRLADEGAEDAARSLLVDLLAGYRGEAFEEDPYEVWAAVTRDHVRAAWVQALRLAARLHGRAGDIDGAVTALVRLLAADPFDEPAHRMLVAVLVRAGRHGEARRAYDRWTAAMTEVGADAPDARVLGASGATARL
ncbi:MAG: BTAD domain-containing putative transcriptional regulator [Nocardioidaceae bacterium]